MTSAKHTILVVDDEKDAVEMIRRMLRGKFDVVGVTTIDAALEVFQTSFFDVVIADQRLADGTGTQLLARFAELNPLTRRISMSGNAEHSDLMAAINVAKVSRFVLKPIDRASLLATIDEALAEYERERAAMEQMLMARYARLPAENPRLAPREEASGVRSRPDGWPSGPGIERINEANPEALAALFAQGLNVGVALLEPESPLPDDRARAWAAEIELRLVTMLRESDHSFRLPGSRFVVAFARTSEAGCQRACERLTEGIPGGLSLALHRWTGTDEGSDPVTLARHVLAG